MKYLPSVPDSSFIFNKVSSETDQPHTDVLSGSVQLKHGLQVYMRHECFQWRWGVWVVPIEPGQTYYLSHQKNSKDMSSLHLT